MNGQTLDGCTLVAGLIAGTGQGRRGGVGHVPGERGAAYVARAVAGADGDSVGSRSTRTDCAGDGSGVGVDCQARRQRMLAVDHIRESPGISVHGRDG